MLSIQTKRERADSNEQTEFKKPRLSPIETKIENEAFQIFGEKNFTNADTLSEILHHLNPKELTRLGLVSKQFHDIILNDQNDYGFLVKRSLAKSGYPSYLLTLFITGDGLLIYLQDYFDILHNCQDPSIKQCILSQLLDNLGNIFKKISSSGSLETLDFLLYALSHKIFYKRHIFINLLFSKKFQKIDLFDLFALYVRHVSENPSHPKTHELNAVLPRIGDRIFDSLKSANDFDLYQLFFYHLKKPAAYRIVCNNCRFPLLLSCWIKSSSDDLLESTRAFCKKHFPKKYNEVNFFLHLTNLLDSHEANETSLTYVNNYLKPIKRFPADLSSLILSLVLESEPFLENSHCFLQILKRFKLDDLCQLFDTLADSLTDDLFDSILNESCWIQEWQQTGLSKIFDKGTRSKISWATFMQTNFVISIIFWLSGVIKKTNRWHLLSEIAPYLPPKYPNIHYFKWSSILKKIPNDERDLLAVEITQNLPHNCDDQLKYKFLLHCAYLGKVSFETIFKLAAIQLSESKRPHFFPDFVRNYQFYEEKDLTYMLDLFISHIDPDERENILLQILELMTSYVYISTFSTNSCSKDLIRLNISAFISKAIMPKLSLKSRQKALEIIDSCSVTISLDFLNFKIFS